MANRSKRQQKRVESIFKNTTEGAKPKNQQKEKKCWIKAKFKNEFRPC